jgi:hypothetical protein
MLEDTVHVYVVPAGIIVVGGLLFGVKTKEDPLHIVWLCAGITGLGLTTTLYVDDGPEQTKAPLVDAIAL